MANSFRLKLSVSALTALGLIAVPTTGSATSLPATSLPATSDLNSIAQALPPATDASLNISAIAPPEASLAPESIPPMLIAQAAPSPSNSPVWTIESTSSASPPSWKVESTLESTVPPVNPTPIVAQGTIPALVVPVPAPPIPVPATPNAVPPSEKTLTEQAAEIEKQLLELEQLEKNTAKSWRRTGYLASPGITLSNPTGFGNDRNKLFFGVGIARTRINTLDGGAIVGLGLGNADKAIGVELSYTSASISPAKLIGRKSAIASSDRPFGSGGFNIKLHRRFPGDISVALGAESVINIGPAGSSPIDLSLQNELQGTYTAVVTKLIRLKSDPDATFSLLGLTAGLGSGYFLTDNQYTRQIQDGKFAVNPFGSVSLQISRSTSAILEWSGQDLGFGVSFVPFKRLPIVLTPTIRDIVRLKGVGTGPRFTIGIGLGF